MSSKHIFLAVIVQVLSLSMLGQKPTCQSLHTGSFKVYSKESGTTYISRTEKQQIEKNDELGYEVIFDITWTDDCTYVLRPKKLIKGDPAIMGNGNSFVKARIKKITGDDYVAETTSSFSKEKVDFIVQIIR